MIFVRFLSNIIKNIKNIFGIFSRISDLESRIKLLEEKNEILTKISTDQTQIIAALSSVQSEIATEILFSTAHENQIRATEAKKFAVFITNSGSDDDFIN